MTSYSCSGQYVKNKLYLMFWWLFFGRFKYTESVENLAFRKTAIQSSTYGKLIAGRSVDGNFTQNLYYCSHTGFIPKQIEAWWQVNLGVNSEIKNVTIYYSTDGFRTRRLNGFQMFLHSSSNNWRNTVSCYRDEEPGYPPSILTISNCSGHYQYVTIYNDQYEPVDGVYGPILELCELLVYGCPGHTYGVQCENECSSSCVKSRCNVDDGNCLQGCISDRFGHICTHECNCEVSGCDRMNGTCYIPGCKAGWFGDSCNKSCEKNTFGRDCKANCYCLNGTCDRFSGKCEKPGCQAGYIQKNCSTGCTNNTFGFNCNEICHCKNGGCNNVNGVCNMHGCKDGWKGASCNKLCDRDTFGEACGKVCRCLNGTCDPISGICFNEECDPGWTGKSCSEACQNNTFGINCSSTCNCRKGGCYYVNGTCNEPGCKNGFKGKTCTQVCQYGTFGQDCLKNCYCLNTSCDPENGSCYGKGCLLGYEGESCSQTVVQKSVEGLAAGLGIVALLLIVMVLGMVFLFKIRRQNRATDHVTSNSDAGNDGSTLPINTAIAGYHDNATSTKLTIDNNGPYVAPKESQNEYALSNPYEQLGSNVADGTDYDSLFPSQYENLQANKENIYKNLVYVGDIN